MSYNMCMLICRYIAYTLQCRFLEGRPLLYRPRAVAKSPRDEENALKSMEIHRKTIEIH